MPVLVMVFAEVMPGLVEAFPQATALGASTAGEFAETRHEELGGAPLAGFETYGEIALDVGAMSGFHNTTAVVLALPS